MTISDARSFIQPLAVANSSRNDAFAHQGLVEQYWDADEIKRQAMVGALQVMLFEGNDFERQMTAQFFAVVGTPKELMQRVAEQYARSPHDALATLLRDSWAFANPTTIQIIRKLFLQDAAANVRVANAVLYAEPDGATWQRLLLLVQESDDPQTLHDAFDPAFLAKKGDEFVAAMRGKPEAVIRAVAKNMSVDWGPKLLALIPSSGSTRG